MGSSSPAPLDPSLLKPSFPPPRASSPIESTAITSLIHTLNLQPHIEGGYFGETDRDVRRIPNPFASTADSNTEALSSNSGSASGSAEAATRSASTSIFYLLTPGSPLGAFHRNRGRTVHTLHKGRARYVILHADEVAAPDFPGGYGGGPDNPGAGLNESGRWVGKARVEVFTVGQNVEKGERLQWIVDGGKYKASFLLPDDAEQDNGEAEDAKNAGKSPGGCLISETVVPGFEYADHDFMVRERFDVLVPDEWKRHLEWMLRKV